jgi:hypothetical protein
MSSAFATILNWWRARVRALGSLKWDPRWAVDLRLVTLTILNAVLFWAWHLYRQAFDAGERHPWIVLGLMAATLWMWCEFVWAVLGRFKDNARS